MKKTLSPRGVFEASITEEMVFSACRALLELNGAKVHRIVERIPWGPRGRKSQPGVPDCFGWFVITEGEPGHVTSSPLNFFIEFKRPGGAHRPAQERWIAEARQDGVIAFFADSVDAMVREFKHWGINLKGV